MLASKQCSICDKIYTYINNICTHTQSFAMKCWSEIRASYITYVSIVNIFIYLFCDDICTYDTFSLCWHKVIAFST